MLVYLNGAPSERPPGTTVAEVVAELVPGMSGCAVARNGEVVTRSTWERTPLAEGDRLEVLSAAPGG